MVNLKYLYDNAMNSSNKQNLVDARGASERRFACERTGMSIHNHRKYNINLQCLFSICYFYLHMDFFPEIYLQQNLIKNGKRDAHTNGKEKKFSVCFK